MNAGQNVVVYAVMPNVFDVLYEDYFEIKSKNKKTDLNIAEQLYTPAGSQSVIMSEGL